jgi:hypothetical protein
MAKPIPVPCGFVEWNASKIRPTGALIIGDPEHEVPDCNPADFTIFTIPERFAKIGNPHADMFVVNPETDR